MPRDRAATFEPQIVKKPPRILPARIFPAGLRDPHEYDVLLDSDEVICAYGRIGSMGSTRPVRAGANTGSTVCSPDLAPRPVLPGCGVEAYSRSRQAMLIVTPGRRQRPAGPTR